MARYLALDVGSKRIGVALSDALNITAQGLDTIEQKNQKETFGKIKGLIEKHEVAKIIVGLPLNMNGTKGDRAKLIEEFARLLEEELSVDVELLDERLTTLQGERLLIEADVSRKKRKGVIDKIAAQLILQTYLDSNV